MKRTNVRNDFLYVSISSFVLVAIWIGLNLYHSAVTSTIAPDLEIQINPIEPEFNINVIQNLKTRLQIAPAYELDRASSEASIAPSPTIQLTPAATNSARLQQPVNSIERLGQ